MGTESIRVDAGLKRILINGDEKKVLEFNPYDILFAERFYALIEKFEQKRKEYDVRFEELEKSKVEDVHGLPKNLPDSFALMRDIVGWLHNEIDTLFGPKTSKMVFGDQVNLDMVQQFFDGLFPFIEDARKERLKGYTKPAKKK